MDKHHYRVSEVMRRVGRSKQGVYKMIENGDLSARRVGHDSGLQIWITKVSVAAWMVAQIETREREIAALYSQLPAYGYSIVNDAAFAAARTVRDMAAAL